VEWGADSLNQVIYGSYLRRSLVYNCPFPAKAIAEFRIKKPVIEEEEDDDGTFKPDFSLGQQFWGLDDLAKQYSEKYDVKNWVAVNTVITISWQEWQTFDSLLKRAIVNEVNFIVEERDRKSNELLNNIKSSTPTSTLNSPSSVLNRDYSSSSRFFR
jgi:hypothetical protein